MAEEAIATRIRSQVYQSQLLIENVKDIFLDADTADVHFTFDSIDDSVIRVPAHKILLAISSNVFKRMFYSELKEKGDVSMVDVSDAAFKEFLQYFYLSEVTLTEENIVGVIYLGQKYNVKKCVEDCTEFLMNTLSGENIFVALYIGSLYERQELIKACESFIAVNTEAVLKSPGFLQCDKQVLAHILKMDVLSCTEVDIFEACMAWVKSKSGQDILTKELVDTHLGELYYEIRFASMSMQNLCLLQMQAEYEPVLRSDFSTIANMIVLPPFIAQNFNNDQRLAKWDAANIVRCDRTTSDPSVYINLCPIEITTTFSTSKPLLLGSFVCVKVAVCGESKRQLRSDLSLDVKITETIDMRATKWNCVVKMRAKLQSRATKVLLPYPILIKPGFFYRISIGKFPDEHCFHCTEMKTQTLLESDIMVYFHNCQTAENTETVVDIVSALNFNRI